MISWKSIRAQKAGPGLSGGMMTLENPRDWISGDSEAICPESALKLPAVYRCIAVLSDSIGEMPVSVKNWTTREDFNDHYLGKVLWQRPNEAMTPSVYRTLLERNRNFRGNGYAYINRSPSTGRAVELIPLPPDYVTVHLSDSGRLWYGFVHPVSGHAYSLDPMQLLHYKNYSEDGLSGVSTLHYAARTLATSTARDEYDRSMYINGGSPAGVLQTESDMNADVEVTDADGKVTTVKRRDIIRREWERVHGGAAKAFRVAVLDLGLKYQPISVTNADAQFVENKEISILDACRFFGVPPHKVYAGKQSYDSNEANSIDFITDTMQPIVTQYEQEDNWKLLTSEEVRAGLVVSRNMMVTLRGNSEARAAWHTAMRNIGVYSVNDIRKKEGEPDVPGGDTRYANLNNIPLERFDELSVARNLKGGNPNNAD
jgi:phage portal protein, HK97 family